MRTPGKVKAEMGYVGAKHRLFITHPMHDGLLPWSDDDALFIVKAWNCHDDLVGALEALLEDVGNAGTDYYSCIEDCRKSIAMAHKALALVKYQEAPE